MNMTKYFCVVVLVFFSIFGVVSFAAGEQFAELNNISLDGVVFLNGVRVETSAQIKAGDLLEVKSGEAAVLFNDGSKLDFSEGNYIISSGSIKINIESDDAMIMGTVNQDCNVQSKLFRASLKKGIVYIKIEKGRARIEGNNIEVQENPLYRKEIIKENKIVEISTEIEAEEELKLEEDRFGEVGIESGAIQEEKDVFIEQSPEPQPAQASPAE